MKYRDPQTGEFKDITVKVADTLPVGTEVDYDGTKVPSGWEEVDDVVVTENVVSRNIFNGLLELGNYNENGAKTTSDGIYRNINMIYIKPNMQYTFSIDGIGRNYVALFYDIDKNFISSISTVDYSVTSPENAYYMNFRCYIADFTSDFKNLKLQIEKGTSATNYTPYLNMQELEKKTRITSGKGTVNSDYISVVENNHWERCGNVVSYSFTMTTNGVWDNTTKFISGLPKAKAEVRFSGIITWDDGILLRLSVSENGEIANAYSNRKPEKGNVIEGHITYITDEEE